MTTNFICRIWVCYYIYFDYFLGYVLDCLPSVAIGWKSVEEQISFLKELDLKPDVIINLKVQVEHLISYYYFIDKDSYC